MVSSGTADPTRDHTRLIAPVGPVDRNNAYRVREAVDAALTDGKPAKIVIDLAGVTAVDSTGIGVLVSCYHTAAASGVPLAAANPSPVVYRQFWLAGLVGLFGLATPHRYGRDESPAAA